MKGIIAIVLLAGAIVAVQQFALPTVTRVQELRRELAEIEEIERKVADVEGRRKEALERRKSISDSDLAQLNMILPEKISTEELYVFFDIITRQAGVNMDSINVGEASLSSEDVRGKKVLQYELAISGTYRNIRTFLENLEKNARLSEVRSLDITRGTGEEYMATIHSNLYYAD